MSKPRLDVMLKASQRRRFSTTEASGAKATAAPEPTLEVPKGQNHRLRMKP